MHRSSLWFVDTKMFACLLRHMVVQSVEVVGCHSVAHADEYHRTRKTLSTLTMAPMATSRHPLICTIHHHTVTITSDG